MFIQRTVIFFIFIFFSMLAHAQEQEKADTPHSNSPDSTTNATLDTLRSTIALDTLQSATSKIDSTQQALQHKIDSLQTLNHPHEKYVQKLDSLSKMLGNKINEQVQKAEQKVREKAENIKTKLTDKVADQEQLEGIQKKLPDEQLAELPGELPIAEGLNVPGSDIKTDEIIPDNVTQDLDLDLKDKVDIDNPVDVSEQTNKVEEIKSVPGEKIDKAKEAGKIGEVADGLYEVGEVTGQMSEYQEDINKAKEGDMEGVEQRVEEQAGQIDEIDYMKNETAEFDKLKKEQENYMNPLEDQKHGMTQYSDPEWVKQRILEKSKHVVQADVLSQYKEKIAAAQQGLSLVNAPDLKADSLQKMMKLKKANPLKDKPLRERLRPGFQMEINRQFYTNIDFTGVVGYRANDKLKIYGGYMYRFNFDNDKRSFSFQQHTYGPRIQVSYEFYKGFFVSAQADHIRTDVPSGISTAETVREWVNGGYLGIGREYSFARMVKGNVQINYNFLHGNDSPYPKKFNIRFGFEFDLTKRKKMKLKVPKDKSFRKKLKPNTVKAGSF